MKKGQTNLDTWKQMVIDCFERSNCVKENTPPQKSKEDVVRYSMLVWPILFSKFYEARKVLGPQLPKDNVIIAVNSVGINLIDDDEQILLDIIYPEIIYVDFKHIKNSTLHNFILTTVSKEQFIFESPEADTLFEVVSYILNELRNRSTYVVAIRDYKHPGDASSFLVLKRGDLIILKNELKGEQVLNSTWGYGECNGKKGDFPTEVVHVLPCLFKPPSYILNVFKKENIFELKQPSVESMNSVQRMKIYTLAQYAKEHFRSGRRHTVSHTSVLATARRNSKEELWKHTNEPIMQPLLKKILQSEDLSKKACDAFTAILKYMEDIPAPKPKVSNEYTNEIFSDAIKEDLLKDEIYCQIMRQVTYNKSSLSEEKGWELLYLAAGLFLPSLSLMEELVKFLKSRTHILAEQCLKRLNRTQKVGHRKYPPYSVEVEAIQHKSLEIYHKIYFPDDTNEAFEINSMTKASELCTTIANRLNLKSKEGFSLFVMMTNKVFSVPEGDFFYDFLHELLNWLKKVKPNCNSATSLQVQYQVFFFKKLWVNTIPGKDPKADQIFHFHQELPKYIKGYHKCTKQEAVKLGALILRAKFGTDSFTVRNSISSVIKDIIPVDLIKAQGVSDWKKSIIAAYSTDGDMSVEEAKFKFLQYISQWPTFGSTFFEVKQNAQPEKVIIAINKKGVNLIHPQSKVISYINLM